MLTIPVAILVAFLHFHFADERAANRVAHEICPNDHVERVDDHFAFGCAGRAWVVRCDHGECAVEAP